MININFQLFATQPNIFTEPLKLYKIVNQFTDWYLLFMQFT